MKQMKKMFAGWVAVIGLLAFVMPASALNDLIFDGGPAGTGTGITTAENWNPDQVPTSTNDLTIGVAFSTGQNFADALANIVLLQGTHTCTFSQVPYIIDGGSLSLGGGGGAFLGRSSADLINGGTITFRAKTATEAVSQYGSKITIDGAASIFGSDPLVHEAGDNAIVTENGASGADNVTVSIASGNPSIIGAFEWTDAGGDHGTGDVENWLIDGAFPTETPSEGLTNVYSLGVVISNATDCTGNLNVGENPMVIHTVANAMQSGDLIGSANVGITDATVVKGIVSNATVTLNETAILQLTDGGTPVAGDATIDLNSLTASLRFDNETATDFLGEHASKVSAFGSTVVLGVDPFTQEPGDNALAIAFNGVLGVEIKAVVVDTNVIGALIWTQLAATNLTGNVTNWVSTATGTYPSETPWEGLALNYSDGVVIPSGTPDGPLNMGNNDIVIRGGASVSNSFGTGLNGGDQFPSVVLSNATFTMQWCAEATITLADNALMNLNGGGGPLGDAGQGIHSTIDFVSVSARLQFNNETLDAFIAEHEAFITIGGAPAVFGSDYYVEETGDNAIATDFNIDTNSVAFGVEIQALGIAVRDPIGDLVIDGPEAGGGMTITWDSSLDQVYNVETNSNLIIANWGIADTTIGTGGSITVTTAVDQAQTFYKVTTP